MAGQLASWRLSRGRVHYRADAQAWLAERGLLADAWISRAPGRAILVATPTRENAVWEPGPRGVPAYDKRGLAITVSDVWKASRRAGRLTSPLLHEWAMLWTARERGIVVPEPVAVGVKRGALLPRTDFLVTDLLPGTSLDRLAERLDAIPVRGRHAIAAAAGRAVAGLHAAGIAFPGLFAKHLFLERDAAGAWRAGFLDLTSAYESRRPSRRERARDVAAIAASLPFRAPASLRLRFLRAYLGNAGRDDLRRFWRDAHDGALRLLRLRRFRRAAHARGALQATEAPPGAVPVVLKDELAPRLRDLVLATFRAGLLPGGPLLPHLVVTESGDLHWAAGAPLAAPRRARRIHAWWRIALLRRDVARSPLSPPVRRSVARWLGGAPLAAFTLADL
jgi:hypothetical protein